MSLEVKEVKKPLVVNLYGGPGSGKSTTAAAVFALLKMHGVNAELVTEVAKGLTWEERYKTLANQKYIWGKQYNKMYQVMDKVDVIITDGPLMLSVLYDTTNDAYFHTVVHNSYLEFNNVDYFIKRVKEYNPVGRYQTEDEAKALDVKTLELLSNYHMTYTEVIGGWEGANHIAGDILNKLRLTMSTKFVYVPNNLMHWREEEVHYLNNNGFCTGIVRN